MTLSCLTNHRLIQTNEDFRLGFQNLSYWQQALSSQALHLLVTFNAIFVQT